MCVNIRSVKFSTTVNLLLTSYCSVTIVVIDWSAMMHVLIISVFLLCVWDASSVYIPYRIVRLNQEGNETAYLITSGVAKAIPDEDSIETLGFKSDALETISVKDLRALKAGGKIESLKYHDKSLDELTRVEIVKSRAIQGELIYGAIDVGNYINPSIVKWQGRLLSASCLSVGVSGSKQKLANGHVEFRWVNHTDYPFHTTDPYLGIENEIEGLSTTIVGQDPRIVVLESNPDRFHVYFTNQLGEKHIRMGMAVVVLNKTTNAVYVKDYHMAIYPMINSMQDQKNWSPFHYRNEVLLIQSINPFIVVKTKTLSADQMIAYHESTTEMVEYYWPYGDLRGGTNAVFLPEKNAYFAFFHSAGHVPGVFMKTYFMGAYLFSAEAPFRVLSLSPHPIMPEQFYTGAWNPLKNRKIDYCLFPMSIFLEKEKEEIVLSLGHQDSKGYLVRVKLQAVLDSLVPVKTKVHAAKE